MHCEVGSTQGPLGYVSTRRVHWRIRVAPECLRSHNTRTSCLNLITTSIKWFSYITKPKFASEIPKRTMAKWQWNAQDCATGLQDRRKRECNPVTSVECVSLSSRTHPCVLAIELNHCLANLPTINAFTVLKHFIQTTHYTVVRFLILSMYRRID